MRPADCPPAALVSARSPWPNVLPRLLVLVALAPVLAAWVGSFGGSGGGYVRWWGTRRGWEALGRTMEVSSLAALIALILAWVLAASAARCSRRLAWPMAMISCLPMLIPSSALATAWMAAMGPASPLGAAWARTGLSVYCMPAAAVALALRYFGIAAAILTHHQLQQASRWPAQHVFGIGGAAAIRLHLQPAARATAVAGLLVMLFAMNDHIIPGMLLVSTYGPQVMIQYSALLDAAGAAALAVPIAGVGMALAAVALAIGRRAWSATPQFAGGAGPPAPVRRRVGAGILAALVLAAALAAPLGVMVVRAGSAGALVEALCDAGGQVARTAFCAAAAGLLCAALAAVLAEHWTRCRRAGSFTAVPLVLLNLTVPATLLGIGMIELTRWWPLRPLRDSSWPLILAYVARFLPVATLALYAAWRNDSSVGELAGTVHGLGRWRRALRIAWPRRRESLLAAAVLCALLAATELEMSILLAAPGRATLGIRLYTLIHTAPEYMVSALTLAILALVSPGLLVLTVLLWRSGRPKGEGS